MSAVALVARYRVQSGAVGTVLTALERMDGLVREREPGCLHYQVSRCRTDENVLVLYEIYVDENALVAHRETEHFKELIEGLVVPVLNSREREVLDIAFGGSLKREDSGESA